MKTLACAGALLLVAATVPSALPRAGVPEVPVPEWRSATTGLERTAFEVRAYGEGWRTRIVAIRIDPARFRFHLRSEMRGGGPGWSVHRAPATAIVALNAGQFSGIAPWGWVVTGGAEIRAPGSGPLSTAIAWDAAGRVRWLDLNELGPDRMAGGVVEAIQSYPTLLDVRGDVPRPIREPGLGVDVEHRDGRLAIGALADGRLLIAITRFYGLGTLSPPVPLGLTLEEMAGVMRQLGCRRAVSLDGGISAQLLLREGGQTEIWRGWRPVPLGLVAEPADTSADLGTRE